jgi:hypothetical protein
MDVRSRASARAQAAAAIACTALTLLVLGHGATELVVHDHAEHGMVAACVLLFTVLLGIGLAAPSGTDTVKLGETGGLLHGLLVVQPVDGRARASPSALQRFRS